MTQLHTDHTNTSTQPMGASGLGRVLIVEDDALLAVELDRRLSLAGFEVIGVVDRGEDALRAVSAQRPDVILMDVFIRGRVDGIDTAHALKKITEVPVVFMTDHHDEATLQRALDASPYGYLVKPLEQRTLCATLRIAIEQHRITYPQRLAISALQAANTAIVLTTGGEDGQPRVAIFNEAAREQDPALVLGAPYRMGPPDEAVAARLQHALSLGLRAEGVLERVGADGAKRWSAVFVGPIPNTPDLRAPGMVLQQDITWLRETDRTLAEQQRTHLAAQLTAGVAHDFNNILQVILAFADMAGDGLQDASRRADLAEVIRAAERGATLTRKLLKLSRREAGEVAALELGAQLEQLFPMCVQLAGGAIRCALELESGPVEVRIAPAELERVVLNLVANARDAMPEGGSITIRLKREQEQALLEVEDTGRGIDAAALPHIFEAFFTTKAEEQGTGLGLSTCKAIVEEASGRITAHSAAGRGTTLRIYLPMYTRPPMESGLLPPLAQGATCLLVTPDLEERATCAGALRRAGFRVIEAITGEEACRKLEVLGGELRLLVCEHTLPDMLGLRVIQAARAMTPNTPHLLMASQATQLAPSEAILWRPFSEGTLVRAALDALLSAPSGEAEAEPTGSPRRALLVERDVTSRRALAGLLNARKIEVIEASQVDEALEIMATHPADVVVVDASMMGVEVMERMGFVRRLDALVPTLVIVSDASLELAQRVLKGQSTLFLQKPLRPGQFAEVVERLIAQRHRAISQRERQLSPPAASISSLVDLDKLIEAPAGQLCASLAYQPVLHIHDDEVVAYETLWRSGESFVTHIQLLRVAQRTQKLAQTASAIHRQLARVMAIRVEFEGVFLCAVTHEELLSGVLLDPEGPLYGEASRVVIELSAREPVLDHEALLEALGKHRACGYLFGVSELGEGHDGLGLLGLIQPKLARLDPGLTQEIHTSSLQRGLVRSIVYQCRRAKIMLVGTAVTSLEEAMTLKDLGCDCVQGRFIAYPSAELPRPLRKLETNW